MKETSAIMFLLAQLRWTFSYRCTFKNIISYFYVRLSPFITFHKINIHFQNKIALIFTEAFLITYPASAF